MRLHAPAMKARARLRRTGWAGMALLGALAGGAAQAAPALPESEQANVATLPAPQPGWFFVFGGWNSSGTGIFDGASGTMMGMVNTSRSSELAIDPAGKYYYVAETIWTKGNRGTRQDFVAVYDSATLKLVTEIPIPGRIIVGSRKRNFVVSEDGKTAFVYNLSPASSVQVVDLEKRKFVRNIELPGCAALVPVPGVGFSALCSDGSMATVAISGAKQEITRSAPFFSATQDPIFDNYLYDEARKQAVFLTYTGQIITAALGAKPSVEPGFSIQAAAGIRVGETKPLDVNWYPGGRQPYALNKATGHLYVLMHTGEFWSHKDDGTEIWDVDLAARKVVKRFPLELKAGNIEVSQGARPLIMVNHEDTGLVIDPATWTQVKKIDHVGGGQITVFEPKPAAGPQG